MNELISCINEQCFMKQKCGRSQINTSYLDSFHWTSSAYFEPSNDLECDYLIDLIVVESNYYKLRNLSC